jgi:hypothetical protein
MSSASLSGFEYYVIFVDDFSRKSWIFFMRTKGQVFRRFQELKALLENQTEKKIEVLRSNNGGEYTSSEFNDFCAREGIKRELIVTTTRSRMGLLRGRTWTLLGLREPCYMIRDYRSFFGLRHATLQFICRTRVHTESWGIRLLRRLSLGRSLMLGTLGFLDALHIHMSLLRRRQS